MSVLLHRRAEPRRRSASCPACSAFRCCAFSAISPSIARGATGYPHDLSRRALPSDRLGLALCGLRGVLVDADRAARSGSPIRSRSRGLERFKMRHTYFGNLPGPFRGLGLAAVLARLPDVAHGDAGRWRLASAARVVGVDWDKAAAGGRERGATRTRFFEADRSRVSRASYAAIVLSIGAVVIGADVGGGPVIRCSRRWCCAGGFRGCASATLDRALAAAHRPDLRRLSALPVVALGCSRSRGGIVGGMAYSPLVGAAAAVKLTTASETSATPRSGIVSYVMVMLGYSAIYQGTVQACALAARLGVRSSSKASRCSTRVKAEGRPSSAVGEGLADALNVGGF